MRFHLNVRKVLSGLVLLGLVPPAAGNEVAGTRYARFRVGDREAYGIVQDTCVREIAGDLFGVHHRTERTYALTDVELLVPTEPRQVFALAGNYLSHMKGGEVPEKFRIPQPFLKTIGSLVPHGQPIVLPHDATDNVHYEAEMVIVIGRKARNVSVETAHEYVFGVTVGNDVSERFWQNDPKHRDIQWWRAKGADTFGPCGPFIVCGADYDNLQLELRLNGEVMQRERTAKMVHGVAATVSYISRYVTMYPGDLIFTGTPGKTGPIHDGDVVEVELEGLGVLRNPVVRQPPPSP